MRIFFVLFVLALPVGGLGRLCSSAARVGSGAARVGTRVGSSAARVGSRVGSGAARAGRAVPLRSSIPRRLAGGGALGASDDAARAGGKAKSALKEGVGNADSLLELGSGSDDDGQERRKRKRR
jgi:hypothetical protein